LETTVVDRNTAALASQLRRLLPGALVLDNTEWWGRLSVIEFLSETGRHLRLQSMLARESVKQRLGGEGMSLAELSYQALQAGDFVHLHRSRNVVVQVGGADQWGNITAGIELAKRAHGLALHGITVPLLTAGGVKMGKSAGNAVWLDADRCAPYDLHHYLVNVPDADAARLLRSLLGAAAPQDTAVRATQQALADGVVAAVHGPAALAAVLTAQRVLFAADALAGDDLRAVAAALLHARPPGLTLPAHEALGAQVWALAVQAGLCASKTEAKRLVQAGGLYVNGVRAPSHTALLAEVAGAGGMPALLGDRVAILRAGRKHHRVLYVESISPA
jgi:tyrosyl-tRNA synthetase